jgi:hypothetical protein
MNYTADEQTIKKHIRNAELTYTSGPTKRNENKVKVLRKLAKLFEKNMKPKEAQNEQS